MKPEIRKRIALEFVTQRKISISRACRLMRIHKSYFYYKSVKDDNAIETAIRDKAGKGGDGFWKIFHMLRNDGYRWNHKRVYRVYKALKYNLRTKVRKRLPSRVKKPLLTPTAPNQTWSIDFMTDVLESHRKFRILNIIDDYNRAAIGQKAAATMPAQRVIRILEDVIRERGKPVSIRCDNGPEFISHVFQDWCKANEINILYTQPGCPTQNSYIERFNGSYRRAVLDAYLFKTIGEVQKITDAWREYYNQERPHEALGNLSPMQWDLEKAAS